MPRDKRLYMTFPIDIHRHPKMRRLSPAAKWAFVEMNGEARIIGNDGRFTADDAEYLWTPEILDELLHSHPARPVVVRDGTDYVIRDYSEHQMTVAAIEELSAKRSAAGRQGAAVTNAKRSASAAASAAASADDSAASAEQIPATGRQLSAESESESEIDLTSDVTHHHLSVTGVDARENTDGHLIDHLRKKALVEADRLHIADLTDVRDWLEKASGRTLNLGEAVELAGDIIGRSKHPVESGDRYVIGTCRKSPGRVAAYADALDLGVVA